MTYFLLFVISFGFIAICLCFATLFNTKSINLLHKEIERLKKGK